MSTPCGEKKEMCHKVSMFFFYPTEITSAAAASPPVDKENFLQPTSLHQQNGNVPKKTSWSPQVAHHMEDSFFGYQEMANARFGH